MPVVFTFFVASSFESFHLFFILGERMKNKSKSGEEVDFDSCSLMLRSLCPLSRPYVHGIFTVLGRGKKGKFSEGEMLNG